MAEHRGSAETDRPLGESGEEEAPHEAVPSSPGFEGKQTAAWAQGDELKWCISVKVGPAHRWDWFILLGGGQGFGGCHRS